MVHGQSLRVPSSSTDRTTPGVFSVILESPLGKAPLSLQWEISASPAIAIGAADIGIGQAAESSVKFLTCAARAKELLRMRYACILAGGQEPIKPGQIAIVHYRAQIDVRGAPIRVGIEKVLGASANSKKIEIQSVDAIIRIR
jgi:hypothetical protein